MTAAGRAPALVDTRISGREHRPRALAAEAGQGEAQGLRDREATDAPPSNRAERARRARYLRQLEEDAREKERAKSLPAYIHACFNNPDRHRTYWVYTWKPGNPEQKTRVPYQCGSWKCQHCRQHAGHVLFSRLQEAFKGLKSSDVVFVVLTLDPEEHRRGSFDLDAVYRDFGKRQNRWMKRLRRWLVESFGHDMANRWASVTECHRTGVPHVNIAIHHPGWARELRELRDARQLAGLSDFEAIRMQDQLAHHAEECGFGWRCTAEANRYGNTEAISGYLVKGVKNADNMHAELAKLCQVPVMAPKNFRRLRAGKGFIPPKQKGECTGTIIRRYWTPEGDEQTEPLSRPKFKPEPNPEEFPEAWEAWEAERQRKLAYMAEVEHAVAIEQVCAWEAEGFRSLAVVEGKGERREECVSQFTRRADGATVRNGVVVLNSPRPITQTETTTHGKKEQQPSETDHRNGGGRDGPHGDHRSGGVGPGEPPRGGARAADARASDLESIRVHQVAHPAVQLSFDSCGRDGRAC